MEDDDVVVMSENKSEAENDMSDKNVRNDYEAKLRHEEQAIEKPMCVLPGNSTALGALEDIGRDIFFYGRVNPNKINRLMVHVSVNFPMNVMGGRVKNWLAKDCLEVDRKRTPIGPINCKLDGAAFRLAQIQDIYKIKLFPHLNSEADPFSIHVAELPCRLHTPDFAIERMQLGRDFCMKHVVMVKTNPDVLFMRNSMGHLVTKKFYRRHKRRSMSDGEKYLH